MKRLVFVGSALLLLACAGCKTATTNPAPAVDTGAVMKTEQDAGKGDPAAQYALGIMYFNGEGKVQDKAKAMEWFAKAANQGLDNAEYTMGYMTDKGETVPKNKAKAMEWFQKAADQGHEESIYRLGLAYSETGAVKLDYVQAYGWLSLVADGDTRAAQALQTVKTRLSPDQLAAAQKLAADLQKRIHLNAEPPPGSQ